MTLITLQDGQVVLRDGQVGTEKACCCDLEDECTTDEECCFCLFEFVIPEPLEAEPFQATKAFCENCGGIFTDFGGGLGSCQQYIANPDCGPCENRTSCIGGLGFAYQGYCCEGECLTDECNPLP